MRQDEAPTREPDTNCEEAPSKPETSLMECFAPRLRKMADGLRDVVLKETQECAGYAKLADAYTKIAKHGVVDTPEKVEALIGALSLRMFTDTESDQDRAARLLRVFFRS
jgi:hypothetical protein